MKVCRFIDADGNARIGILDGETIAVVNGTVPGELIDAGISLLISDVDQWLPPVDPPNVIALGLNYAAHVKEFDRDHIPDTPVMFMKATSSLNFNGGIIELPAMAPNQVDFEAELGIVIGNTASNIEPDEAAEYIYGYTCVNDVTARDCQKNDRQWVRAKSFNTFCPVGPFIETEIDPVGLEVRSVLNENVMQNGNTSDMIFKPHEIVSFISKCMTLLPGTLILTGTPPGVGFARSPQVFLQPGDEIKIEISGLGVLVNKVE